MRIAAEILPGLRTYVAAKLGCLLCVHRRHSVERHGSSKADIPFADLPHCDKWKAKMARDTVNRICPYTGHAFE
jgi:hypothetical protein